MPRPKLPPIEKHKRPFKAKSQVKVKCSTGWQKGNFRHYYYREMRVGKKKDKRIRRCKGGLINLDDGDSIVVELYDIRKA